MEISKPHVFLLASPGMGQIIPLHELAKRLVTFNTLRVTLFVISTSSTNSFTHLIESSSEFHTDLEIIDLTPANILDLMSIKLPLVSHILMITQESIKILQSKIGQMKSPPVALIVDIFSIDAFEVADSFGIKKYVFVTTPAWLLALSVHLPTLDQETEGEYVDLPGSIPIPGCKSIRPTDLPDPLTNRKDEDYKAYLRMCERLSMADGIFLNTWKDLEPQTLNALQDEKILGQILKPHLYPIGPVARKVVPCITNRGCLDWLHKQPQKSVVYVSFGSGGTISSEQMNELASALEVSQQRFIWVVRPPTANDVAGSFFSPHIVVQNPHEYLPDGFLSRTHGMGIVIPNWAPQDYILAHPSIGGFISHCGWNSTLESIINGVPMIAWPLYAEQKMNATILTEDLGFAIRPEILPTQGVVKSWEIERTIRLVMENKEGIMNRERVEVIKNHALNAYEKSGSSYNTLLEIAKEWEGEKLRDLMVQNS